MCNTDSQDKTTKSTKLHEQISVLCSERYSSQSVFNCDDTTPRNPVKSHTVTNGLNNLSELGNFPTSTAPPPFRPARFQQSQQFLKQSSPFPLKYFRLGEPSNVAVSKTGNQTGGLMLGNSVVPPCLLPPLDNYRLQLYNYAMVERLRCSQYPGPLPLCPPNYPAAAAAAAAVGSPYGPRFALSMSLFHNRVFQPEEPKPQHSYIGLIAMAILSSPESKLVLSDIYQHILDNYPYFRTRGPGWRNSIRHNLSLNDCFIKAGRSANGKGHYWAIHPANIDDFKKGDFRRRKAQRKVRKHMGLAVDDEGTDSPSPPPLAVTPPPYPQPVLGPQFCPSSWAAVAAVSSNGGPTTRVMTNSYSQSRKRQFDVASLLAPDDDDQQNDSIQQTNQSNDYHQYLKGPATKRLILTNSSDIDEDIDVVASDAEDITNAINNQNLFKQNDDDNNMRYIDGQHDHQLIGICSNQTNDDDTTESPTRQNEELTISRQHTPPSPTSPQDLMQQWPANLSTLRISAMDPRILGRYYEQYMVAAASRRAAVVGNLLNTNFSISTNNSAMGGSTEPDETQSQQQQQQQQQHQQQQQQQHHQQQQLPQ